MDRPVNARRFHGWVPFRLYWQAGEPGVEWLYMGANRFSGPFFEQTMYFEAQTPFNSLFRFRTPLAALAEWSEVSPGVKPAGFIFHLSRCGSTLITRLLTSLPRNLVLSEPGLLDLMLRSHEWAPRAPLEQRAMWLRWLVSALGQRRSGLEQRLFVKFDPRNIVDFPLLRLAFPGVPWIFVYRNPVEVMVSNLRAPSLLVTPGIVGADFLNFDASLVAGMDYAEYVARVLGIVAETAARHAAATGGMPIDYTQLPAVVWGDLERNFGLDLTPDEVDQLKQVAAFDAKKPDRRFVSDTEDKRQEADDRVRRAAEQWISPHCARLEEIRLAHASGFAAFRRFLLDHPVSLDRLRGLDRDAFIDAALQSATQSAIQLDRSGIERAIADARAERARRLL
jgi:hypothetical protein